MSVRTDPYTIEHASVAQRTYEIDMTPQLAVGESVSSPAATLTNLGTGAAGPALTPTAAGNVVRITLPTALAIGRYRLVVTFTAATGETPATETIVEVPF